MFFQIKRPQQDKFHIPILAYMAWSVVVFLLNDCVGANILMNIFLGVGVYFTIVRYVGREHYKLILNTILTIGGFAILYLCFQLIGFDIRGQIIRNNGGVPQCSFFGIEHAFGFYVGCMIPILLVLLGWVNIILVPILLGFIVFSKSSSAMLGSIVAVMFYLWTIKRKVFWFVCIPLLIGLVAFVHYDGRMGMHTTRLDMWKKVIQDSNIKPLGHGLDSFRRDERDGAVKYFKYPFCDTTVRAIKDGDNHLIENVDPRLIDWMENDETKNVSNLDFWDSPHNELIWAFHAGGIPMLAIIFWVMWATWKRFSMSTRNRMATAMFVTLVAFFIFCMTEFPFALSEDRAYITSNLWFILYINGDREWH